MKRSLLQVAHVAMLCAVQFSFSSPAIAGGHSGASGDYVYKQDWMPREEAEIDLSKTAMFVTDPQNDFLSDGSPVWALVGPLVEKNKVVEKEKRLKALAKELGVPVFYSTHMYNAREVEQWPTMPLNGIDKVMFENNMFVEGTWGHKFHPELKPDDNTIVLNPHKGLSNFWTGDSALNLRMFGIETVILYGMSANMCVESHARDIIENGFELIIVADATAAAGDLAYEAALTNFEFLAMEVVTTDQIIKRLKAAK
ncbi:MAG: cysteine hydrolase [Gammaproteobacteria bacterium]